MMSSQMSTPGPAISFLTCFCVFPQKLHLTRSPPSPNLATRLLLPVRPNSVRLDLCGADGLERCDRASRDDLVDHTVGDRLFRGHDEVAVGVLGHLLLSLTGVLGQHVRQQIPHTEDLLRL